MRPDPRWQTITLRVPHEAGEVIARALNRFYADGHRPPTDPVALGWLLECLAADYLAGPDAAHPGAGLRKLVAARTVNEPTKETT